MKISILAACLLLTCYSIPLEAATDLSGIQDIHPTALSKPKGMKAIQWIKELEEKRDYADLHHQFDAFETITKEISATMAGKYGFSKRSLTREESLSMIASVIKTRNVYKGKPDILNDFYFGYNPSGVKEKMKDPRIARHMAVIAATDALYAGLVNDWKRYGVDGKLLEQNSQEFLEESLALQRQKSSVDASFIEAVTQIVLDIHDDAEEENLKSLVGKLSPKDWKTLVDRAGLIIDITTPEISFLDVWDKLAISGEEGYKGWQIHQLGRLVNWDRNKNDRQDVQEAKKQFILQLRNIKSQAKESLHPMTSTGVLLTKENKKDFGDIKDDVLFDGTMIAVQYSFFDLLEDSIPLSFYLTRKLPSHSLKALLSRMELKIVDKKTKDYKNIVLLMNEAGCSKQPSYWKKAADLGSLLACKFYGLERRSENFQKYLQYYKFSADRGFEGCFGEFYNLLPKGNTKQKRLYLKIGSLWGNPDFKNHYGAALSDGLGGYKNLPKARRCFQIAAENGSINAQYNYGHFLEEGIGGIQDLQGALKYFKKGAERGEANAQNQYAHFLRDGVGCVARPDLACLYYKKAADQNLACAQYHYAVMLFGEVINNSNIKVEERLNFLKEAKKYCTKAKEQGFVPEGNFEKIIEESLRILLALKPFAEQLQPTPHKIIILLSI